MCIFQTLILQIVLYVSVLYHGLGIMAPALWPMTGQVRPESHENVWILEEGGPEGLRV